jgi:GNAT superfamily N-acetyltransferase
MTQIDLRHGGCGRACRDTLATLPDWFGMEASNIAYEADAETLPTWVATRDGEVQGLMILKRHEAAMENWLLAVRRDLRGNGTGRALIETAVATTREAGFKFLTVKTLGPSHPSEPYAETRAFYRACGFSPLEEFKTEIWGPENPCLFMVRAVV